MTDVLEISGISPQSHAGKIAPAGPPNYRPTYLRESVLRHSTGRRDFGLRRSFQFSRLKCVIIIASHVIQYVYYRGILGMVQRHAFLDFTIDPIVNVLYQWHIKIMSWLRATTHAECEPVLTQTGHTTGDTTRAPSATRWITIRDSDSFAFPIQLSVS